MTVILILLLLGILTVNCLLGVVSMSNPQGQSTSKTVTSAFFYYAILSVVGLIVTAADKPQLG